jgi:hypothetical protein
MDLRLPRLSFHCLSSIHIWFSPTHRTCRIVTQNYCLHYHAYRFVLAPTYLYNAISLAIVRATPWGVRIAMYAITPIISITASVCAEGRLPDSPVPCKGLVIGKSSVQVKRCASLIRDLSHLLKHSPSRRRREQWRAVCDSPAPTQFYLLAVRGIRGSASCVFSVGDL